MAMATAPAAQKKTYNSEDVGNVVLMEHLNVQVPDQGLATLFYIVGLGFTRDPHMMVGLNNMWVNLGEQQFHLPTNNHIQVFRGHIGLVVPDLEGLKERLQAVAEPLKGTKFAWSAERGYVAATCPWGNQFRCYTPDPQRFGPMVQGIPYVEFPVKPGTAEGIARFYEQVFGAAATVEGKKGQRAARVEVGRYQVLLFRETAAAVADYDGHHLAVYIANFSGPYEFMNERGLVTEDVRNHQFRFKDIVDPESGQLLYTIEHEVRSMRHSQFMRPLVNRTIGQFAEPRRGAGNTEYSTRPVM